jgi:hypothetical protein
MSKQIPVLFVPIPCIAPPSRSMRCSRSGPNSLLGEHTTAFTYVNQSATLNSHVFSQRLDFVRFFEAKRAIIVSAPLRNTFLVAHHAFCFNSGSDDMQIIESQCSLFHPVYHAIYLLPLKHSDLLANVQMKLLENSRHIKGRFSVRCCRNTMNVWTWHAESKGLLPSCSIAHDQFPSIIGNNAVLTELLDLNIESFSAALKISSHHFSIFTFVSAAADAVLQSGAFGMRWQCWATVQHPQINSPNDTSTAALNPLKFMQFCSDNGFTTSSAYSIGMLPLGLSLQQHWHQPLIGGLSLYTLFKV